MVDRGSFSKMNQDLSFVDEKLLTFIPVNKTRLPVDFQPNEWTVICGRGKSSFNHVGNRRFRILCEINGDTYERASTKTEKSLIVMNMVDTVREASRMGGFVKQDPQTKEWFEVSDNVAREKVGQQLRENLAKKNGFRQCRSNSLKSLKRHSASSLSSSATSLRRESMASHASGFTSCSSSCASEEDEFPPVTLLPDSSAPCATDLHASILMECGVDDEELSMAMEDPNEFFTATMTTATATM